MTVDEVFQRVLRAVELILVETGVRPAPVVVHHQPFAQALGLRERGLENLFGQGGLPLGQPQPAEEIGALLGQEAAGTRDVRDGGETGRPGIEQRGGGFLEVRGVGSWRASGRVRFPRSAAGRVSPSTGALQSGLKTAAASADPAQGEEGFPLAETGARGRGRRRRRSRRLTPPRGCNRPGRRSNGPGQPGPARARRSFPRPRVGGRGDAAAGVLRVEQRQRAGGVGQGEQRAHERQHGGAAGRGGGVRLQEGAQFVSGDLRQPLVERADAFLVERIGRERAADLLASGGGVGASDWAEAVAAARPKRRQAAISLPVVTQVGAALRAVPDFSE